MLVGETMANFFDSYLTKVDNAATADGSTPWFKIKEIGPKFPGGTWDLSNTYSVNIPSCIPAGEYLLRIEQLGLHNPGAAPQFYISCAQIKVTGGGSKAFSGVSIPGHVKAVSARGASRMFPKANLSPRLTPDTRQTSTTTSTRTLFPDLPCRRARRRSRRIIDTPEPGWNLDGKRVFLVSSLYIFLNGQYP